MESSLRAGVALYTAGDYHAAHEPWEDVWLDLPDGEDERLLHGLIQFTAAIYHARQHNWSGAVGLATQAQSYLDSLPPTHRGIDTEAVTTALGELEADPERIERGPTPPLLYDGHRLTAADLSIDGITIAADAVADEYDSYDAAHIEAAIDFAHAEATGTESKFVGLLTAFVDDRDNRAIVYDRVRQNVERRQAKVDDVSGLFE